jgi:hypothetical protein
MSFVPGKSYAEAPCTIREPGSRRRQDMRSETVWLQRNRALRGEPLACGKPLRVLLLHFPRQPTVRASRGTHGCGGWHSILNY